MSNQYNQATLASGKTFNGGVYHHAVLSISGTTHTLYLDGSMVAQNTNAGNIFSAYSSFNQLNIGCDGSMQYGFSGKIEDFRIYQRPLLQSDVTKLYSQIDSSITLSYPLTLSFSNLALWLDAADSSTITLDSGKVSNWKDKSITLHPSIIRDASNTGLTSVVKSTLFNKPVIHFNTASNSLLYVKNLNINAYPFTYFAVFDLSGGFSMNSTTVLFQGGVIGSANFFRTGDFQLFQQFTTAGYQLFLGQAGGNAGWNIKSQNINNNGLNILSLQFSALSNAFVLNINGSSSILSNARSNLLNMSAASAIRIGSIGVPDLYLSEALLYQSALTTAQIQQIEGYLAWKWGLVSSLPSNHPYYNIAPWIVSNQIKLYDPVSDTTTISLSNTPLSAVTTYYSIATNDYGYILISTNSGIYYSTNYGTSFTLSNNTNACVSVSMDNNGNALACTSTTIYSSTDFGQTWSAVTSPPSSVTGFIKVVNTLTGKSYVCTNSAIYSSTHLFNSATTAVTSGYTTSGIMWISCSSNGYIVVSYNQATEFFNGSTWSSLGRSGSGTIPWSYGAAISDNGNYIAVHNNANTSGVYYATITSGTIGTWKIVEYTNAAGFICVGNNGVIYANNNPRYANNASKLVYQIKNAVLSNINIASNDVFTVSPTGNYASLINDASPYSLSILASKYYTTDFSTIPSGYSALPSGIQANGSSIYGWTVNNTGTYAVISSNTFFGTSYMDPTPSASASGRCILFVIGTAAGANTTNTCSIYTNQYLYAGYTYTLSFFYSTRTITNYYDTNHYLKVTVNNGTTNSTPNPICNINGLTSTETKKTFTFTVPSNGNYVFNFYSYGITSTIVDSTIIVRNITIS